MATVTIKVGGRDYRIACDDGQEEHLRRLADEVDERLQSLLFGMGADPGEGMALLMTALTMADELAEMKREKQVPAESEDRTREIEEVMAATLEEIAGRIERIADRAAAR